MDCRLIQGELIAYYFATTSEEQRSRVDEHLVACTSCLRAYLRLKHQIEHPNMEIEIGTMHADRPSAETKRRLRADVEAAFRPSTAERARRWLRRPIPLYQGIAAAAVALLVASAGPILASAFEGTEEEATSERIDSSRPSPESLSFY
jgi:anti-sigma factor RsiW